MKLTVVSRDQSIYYDEFDAKSNDPVEAVHEYVESLRYQLELFDQDDCSNIFNNFEDDEERDDAVEIARIVVQLLREDDYTFMVCDELEHPTVILNIE